MIEILGSQFETALRYMLLLYQIENLSASKICSLDYIATYAEDFKLASRNINGYNPYRFAEYTMRESLCTDALRSLVLKGIVDAQLSSEGLLYSLSPYGFKICSKFDSIYAIDYRISIEHVVEEMGGLDESSITAIVLKRINESTKEAYS